MYTEPDTFCLARPPHEVVDVIVVDAVLGFVILNRLEPCLDNLEIFSEFSMIIFCLIKSRLELF